MPKFAFILFSCFGITSVFAQQDPGIWAGGGNYKPGEAISEALKSIGGDKKIVLQVGSGGEITGTLDVTYNKATATRPNDATDLSFLIGGKYDSAKHTLLLVVTHLKGPNSSTADKKFKYPDSLLYNITVGKQKGKVEMNGAIDLALHDGLVAEWLSSNRNMAMALAISGKLNMHILPLNIKLEKFVRFADDAPIAAAIPPAIKDPVKPPAEKKKEEVPVAAVTPPAPKEPAVQQSPAEKRKTEIQHTIYLDTSLVKLDMYDNGEIDGDIATLILDGKVIISNQLLSTKAASITLHISKDKPEHLLELYANNLGSIPPNTALLVLTCNRKRYEINLSSNGTQNGTVKLVFAPK